MDSGSKGGFTPGPWVLVDSGSIHTTLISSNADGGTSNNDGIYVARVQGPDNAANARLIAAAPDSLKALQAVMREFFPHATPNEYPEITDARTAIARALGTDGGEG